MATSALPPIRACLFDMDGLLIDSEDLYTRVTNEVLHLYGRPDMPWSIKAQLQGRPGPDSTRIFLEWAKLPCEYDEFNANVQKRQKKYFPESQPLPGVLDLLQTLRKAGVYIALATSSQRWTFNLKTTHLQDLFTMFPKDLQVLGDDPRIPKGRGKPAPDIYLLALKTINDQLREDGKVPEIKPEECLVFEDSVPGVEAGRRAGMQVVWCPHPMLLKEYTGREKEVLAGLTGAYKEEIPPKIETAGQRVAGAPGEIDDGWGVFLKTLESFPYSRFGIDTWFFT